MTVYDRVGKSESGYEGFSAYLSTLDYKKKKIALSRDVIDLYPAREIPLTKGRVALVSECDYEWLSQWKWQINDSGYAGRKLSAGFEGDKRIRGYVTMHRFILNAPKNMLVDHIDQNRLNNCRSNLRLCTHSQNNFNKVKEKRKTGPSRSKYKGVCVYKKINKWGAMASFGGKLHYLGVFSSEVDAAKAYNDFAKEYHGEFACLNEIFDE